MEVVLWFIVAIAVIAVDLLTSSFIFMWFAIGALVAMLASLLGVGLWGQIVIFFIVSIITVAIGYPWAARKLKAKDKKLPTMEENYIGRTLISHEDFSEKSKIKVDGIYWTAFNKGRKIKSGEKMIITGIEGNKLTVKAVKE